MPSKCLKSSWFSGHLSQLEASYNPAPKDTEHLHLKHLLLSIFTQLKHSRIHPKTKNNHMLNIKSGHWKCNDIIIYTVCRAYHWRMLFSLPFCAPQKASRWGQQGSANLQLVTNFQESPESPESLFLYTGTKSTADSRIRSPHPPYNMSHPECWQLGFMPVWPPPCPRRRRDHPVLPRAHASQCSKNGWEVAKIGEACIQGAGRYP